MLPSPAGTDRSARAATRTSAVSLTEAAARRVLLVQAFETDPADNPQWTPEDRAWATRLARETTPAGAAPGRFLDERSQHALQRLAPRDAGVVRALAQRAWRTGWLLAALSIGLLAGVAVDAIGSGQRVNLLAPPVWGVIAWNLLVYIGLLLPVPARARAWLIQRWAGHAPQGTAMARFNAAWRRSAAPLLGTRAALLFHAAAVALALGLISGLYVRGLVLDYRAGWQSTFLDAEQVRAALAVLLSPASAFTGITVPDAAALQVLRVAPDGLPTATASAAPWIHLYAAMLVLFVVLPRTLLAGAAAARAWRLARWLPLPVGDLYLERLLRERQAQAAHVQVLAHGAAPSAHALACLQAVLAGALGAAVQVSAAAATAYGDEDAAAALSPPPGTTLRLALVDLAATPEDDTHGAFVRTLRRGAPALPLVVLADETAFRTRFASIPARLKERRAAWRLWAQALGCGLVAVDLAQPDAAAAERDLQTALQAAHQP
jgi:hypothetical protein